MRTLLLTAVLALLSTTASASHTGEPGRHDWWLLVFTVVLLAGLALYIYFRVQEAGWFPFLPQATAKEPE